MLNRIGLPEVIFVAALLVLVVGLIISISALIIIGVVGMFASIGLAAYRVLTRGKETIKRLSKQDKADS